MANRLKEIQMFISGNATCNEVVNKTLPVYFMGYLWLVRIGGVDPATGRKVFNDKDSNRVLYENGVLPAGRFNWENPGGPNIKEMVWHQLLTRLKMLCCMPIHNQKALVAGITPSVTDALI